MYFTAIHNNCYHIATTGEDRMKTKTRLTIHKIETLKTGFELWDTDVPGLHIRGLKTGKFFYLYYRNKYGDQRKPSLGRFGAITLQNAREKAREYLLDIAKGDDPSIAKRHDREIENPTMMDLKNRWETEYAYNLKSRNTMVRQWEKHILPSLGLIKVRDVTKHDIQAVLNTFQSRYTFNRVRSLLSKAMNLAEDWGWREDYTNPVRKIRKRPEKTRRRYLKPDEVLRLGMALSEWEKTTGNKRNFACFIKLLMFTGARRSEILTAKWAYVDWHRGILDLPDSKTGAKEIILPDPAIEVLKYLQTYAITEWIIENTRTKRHWKYPFEAWSKLLEQAKIDNLRIHDLRHSFASTALSTADGTLQQVGELLGHANPQTTARYAHFMATPKRILANKTASTLDGWLNGNGA